MALHEVLNICQCSAYLLYDGALKRSVLMIKQHIHTCTLSHTDRHTYMCTSYTHAVILSALLLKFTAVLCVACKTLHPSINSHEINVHSYSDVVGSVPCARMFHQFLVVGLIEACKGIQELFPDVLGPGRWNGYVSGSGSFTSNTGGTGSGNGSSSSSSSVAEGVLSAAEAHTQLQVQRHDRMKVYPLR